MSNPYSEPEEFGLTKVLDVELAEPDYSFYILAGWVNADGEYFLGTDSGCSCPTPFEDYNGVADMTGPLTREQVIAEATDLWQHAGSYDEGAFNGALVNLEGASK